MPSMYRPRCLLGTRALAALALLLPAQPARGAPMGLPSDLAVVPGDCAFFLTVRPADILDDELYAGLAILSGKDLFGPRVTHMPTESVERLTRVGVGRQHVIVVRTKK